MKRRLWSATLVFLVLVTLAVVYWRFFRAGDKQTRPQNGHPQASEQSGSGPVARVKTMPIQKGVITEHIIVYGSVIPAPGALQTISIPFESQILGIMVNDGQKVAKGDPLLRIQPSPNTRLQLQQARNAYQTQQESYQQTERRYKLKLATNEQLLQARQSLQQAKLRLQSLTKRGIDGPRQISADVGGLVKKVYAQEGAIVAAGNPLIEIVAQNRLEALLGVEPEDISKVHSGQQVVLTRINAPASPEAAGKVRKISYAVNPSTRLVDVFVPLTSPAGFLLGESITGRIVISAAHGLLVPRSAVLPEGDRHVLFTVREGHAVKHSVEIGLQDANHYQIISDSLRAGEQVVTVGNYELKNNLQVVVEAGK